MLIRADLRASFSCLSFPEQFERSKKNSIDLFTPLIGVPAEGVKSFRFERAFQIRFAGNRSLLFKMFGNQSNIIFYDGEEEPVLFKKSRSRDLTLNISGFDRLADLSFDHFLNTGMNPGKFIPAFDNKITGFLNLALYEMASPEKKYSLILETLQVLENPKSYFISENSGVPILSLLQPPAGNVKVFDHVVPALNYFYKSRVQIQEFSEEKDRLISHIRKESGKASLYISDASRKLEFLEKEADYKLFADILMANLHVIQPGREQVTLTNFYTGQPVTIRLKPGLSPQKNAEAYYRKAKNKSVETDTLRGNINLKNRRIRELDEKLNALEQISGIKALRKFMESHGDPAKGQRKKSPAPFREFHCMEFRILVGKNSRNNEELTFGEGYKEDLWLHARDVPGSHVLIKFRSGNSFPKPVIEKAAAIAAYYSRNRNNTLCPVIYTPKKYVRKVRGGLPGEVIVEKEEIIFVQPGI